MCVKDFHAFREKCVGIYGFVYHAYCVCSLETHAYWDCPFGLVWVPFIRKIKEANINKFVQEMGFKAEKKFIEIGKLTKTEENSVCKLYPVSRKKRKNVNTFPGAIPRSSAIQLWSCVSPFWGCSRNPQCRAHPQGFPSSRQYYSVLYSVFGAN